MGVNLLVDALKTVSNLHHLTSESFLVMAGPCVVEDRDTVMEIAGELVRICDALELPLVFKASYDKANRTSIHSFRGLGMRSGLEMLAEVKREYGVPVVTDVHSVEEVGAAAEVVDILQIPAFLCRQTDLLLTAGRSGRVVNVKKGQFLAAESMRYVVEKLDEAHCPGMLLTERGSMFGYGDLVVDFRGIPVMRSFGRPVVLDVTHSLQQPNQSSGVTGGRPELIEYMARLGIAARVDAIFFETHPRPEEALSDGKNMLPLSRAEAMLSTLKALRKAVLTC